MRRACLLCARIRLSAPSSAALLDAYWSDERFAVELDVYETHGSHAAFEGDRLRQEDLKLKGVEMIRVTGPRLDREPEQVIEAPSPPTSRSAGASSAADGRVS